MIGSTMTRLPSESISLRKWAQTIGIASLYCAACFTPMTPAPALAAQGSKTTRATTNVILITIDTVRADHVGCYGAKNAQTPTLDALGRDGIVFERAISQVPLTWPSHAVVL